jgi:hypothetical protein
MLINDSRLSVVLGITDAQRSMMIEFLKGAINAHCHENPDRWFSIRDFLGGINNDWQNNSFMALYKKHEEKGHSKAKTMKRAGEDAGKLLKIVISYHKRKFETRNVKKIREYKWVSR